MVRTSGYKYLKLGHWFLCGKLPAASTEMRWTYVIRHADDRFSGGSETEMSRRFWIHTIIHRNSILAAKKPVWILCTIVEHPMTGSLSVR